MKTIALVLKCSEEPYVFEGIDGTIVENGILTIVLASDRTLSYPLTNVFNWTISPTEVVEQEFDISSVIAAAVEDIEFEDDAECPVCGAESEELEEPETTEGAEMEPEEDEAVLALDDDGNPLVTTA